MNEKGEREETLFRIIVLIISGIVFMLWKYLIWALAVINWLVTLFSGERNKELAMFCEYFNTEFYKFIRYLTFVSNKRPFPFTDLERMSKFS